MMTHYLHRMEIHLGRQAEFESQSAAFLLSNESRTPRARPISTLRNFNQRQAIHRQRQLEPIAVQIDVLRRLGC